MKTVLVRRYVFGYCNHALYYQQQFLSSNNMYR